MLDIFPQQIMSVIDTVLLNNPRKAMLLIHKIREDSSLSLVGKRLFCNLGDLSDL
jgi:hypothetical protein